MHLLWKSTQGVVTDTPQKDRQAFCDLNLRQAGVEMDCDGLAVEILTDKDELDHAVAVLGIPVARKAGLVLHKLHEFVLGGAGKPESGFGKFFLDSCLLEEEGHVGVVLEVQHAFGTDDVRGPMAVDEEVEFVDVESFAAIVHEGLYTVFLSLAFVVMVVVMVVFVAVMLFVVVAVVMIMVVMMPTRFGLLLVGRCFFDLMHPGCRCGHVLEVEKAGVEQLGKVDIAIVALYDTGFGL